MVFDSAVPAAAHRRQFPRILELLERRKPLSRFIYDQDRHVDAERSPLASAFDDLDQIHSGLWQGRVHNRQRHVIVDTGQARQLVSYTRIVAVGLQAPNRFGLVDRGNIPRPQPGKPEALGQPVQDLDCPEGLAEMEPRRFEETDRFLQRGATYAFLWPFTLQKETSRRLHLPLQR